MPLPIEVQRYVDAEQLTQQQADTLIYEARAALRDAGVRGLIDAGRLPMAQVLTLTYAASEALRDASVQALIADDRLTIAQVLVLTEAVSEALRNAGVRALIADNRLTIAQVLTLTFAASEALRNAGVRALIADGLLPMEEVLTFTKEASYALENAGVQHLVRNGTLTREHRAAITTDAACLALRNAGVRALIADNRLTIAQVLTLTLNVSFALRNAGVRALITAGLLPMAQVLTLTLDASYALENAGVQALITAGLLPMARVLTLTHDASAALRDPDTQRMLLAREITIDDVLGPVVDPAHGAVAVAPIINNGQSTHNASVHRSVSESAARLAARYGAEIDGAGLESVIRRVQDYVNGLPGGSIKNEAAKRCIARITAPDYTFIDSKSRTTTRQLIALMFLAIHDDENRVGSVEDALKQFVEGLYEIQRGYNLSAAGVDLGGPDGPICCAGTINKFIETLQGIHPDCEILFITRETASAKLPIVVQEEAMRYLESLASPTTTEGLRAFTQLIATLNEDGIEVIWGPIEGNIAERMSDEFGSLYRREDGSFDDRSFEALIDAGQYAELPDLTRVQEQVGDSKGYQQYCSQMLHRSGLFSSAERSADRLSADRHNSSDDQQRYDEQFGLVKTPK